MMSAAETSRPAAGLGCMGMSGVYGPADEDESIATLPELEPRANRRQATGQ
jgi:hypothetical protein